MKPNKGEAASQERDGLNSTQSENVVEEEYTTKGEWDLDYELDQVAEITSPVEQSQELRRLKKKSVRPQGRLRLRRCDPEGIRGKRVAEDPYDRRPDPGQADLAAEYGGEARG